MVISLKFVGGIGFKTRLVDVIFFKKFFSVFADRPQTFSLKSLVNKN